MCVSTQAAPRHCRRFPNPSHSSVLLTFNNLHGVVSPPPTGAMCPRVLIDEPAILSKYIPSYKVQNGGFVSLCNFPVKWSLVQGLHICVYWFEGLLLNGFE